MTVGSIGREKIERRKGHVQLLRFLREKVTFLNFTSSALPIQSSLLPAVWLDVAIWELNQNFKHRKAIATGWKTEILKMVHFRLEQKTTIVWPMVKQSV